MNWILIALGILILVVSILYYVIILNSKSAETDKPEPESDHKPEPKPSKKPDKGHDDHGGHGGGWIKNIVIGGLVGVAAWWVFLDHGAEKLVLWAGNTAFGVAFNSPPYDPRVYHVNQPVRYIDPQVEAVTAAKILRDEIEATHYNITAHDQKWETIDWIHIPDGDAAGGYVLNITPDPNSEIIEIECVANVSKPPLNSGTPDGTPEQKCAPYAHWFRVRSGTGNMTDGKTRSDVEVSYWFVHTKT